MSIFKKCPFYRDSKALAVGRGLGHCDLCGQAICEGDIQFCQNPEELRKELSKQKDMRLERKGAEDHHKKPPHYKVLVVDDNESLARMVVAFLSRHGHQSETAQSGKEALNKMNGSEFDVVVTDIVMPEMDGITLTKEILSLYPHQPIMIMTGHSKQYPTESAITAGARDFIEKPFDYDEFILRFNKMMSDHETFLQIETKQKEMLFHIQRESSEKISELQREIESLRSKLYDR